MPTKKTSRREKPADRTGTASSPYRNRGQAKDRVLSVRFDEQLLKEIDGLVDDLRFNSRGLLIRQAVLDLISRSREEGGYFAPDRTKSGDQPGRDSGKIFKG